MESSHHPWLRSNHFCQSWCSWLLSGTSISSKTPPWRTWSNQLQFWKFQSLTLSIWSQEPSWIIHDVPDSSQDHPCHPRLRPGNLVKSTPILKIPKSNTLYMISGTILNHTWCSWLLSGTSISSMGTWSNQLQFWKFQSLTLSIWSQEPSWIIHDVPDSSQDHPCHPRLRPGNLVKSTPILKIPKSNTLYMISGTILNHTWCSWLLSGTSISSMGTWSNQLFRHFHRQ